MHPTFLAPPALPLCAKTPRPRLLCSIAKPASPSPFWEKVRRAVPLSKVFSDHLGPDALIEKKPGQFLLKCPFHSDKTPSCIVNDPKGTYHCFGCGAHGTILDFELQTRQLSTIPQALQSLSSRYPAIATISKQSPKHHPIPLQKPPPPTRPSWRETAVRKRLVSAVLDSVHRLYIDQLWKSDNLALSYLRARNLSDSTIRAFGCGYAGPDSNWHIAVNHLKSEAFSEADAVTAGVAVRAKNEVVYDLFRGRVVTPIKDLSGHTIALSGRLITKHHAAYVPKYVNGPETALFRKRESLFAADLAAKAASCKGEAGYLFVVEGYMDAMTMYDRTAGKVGVVATMGAAMSPEQVDVAAYLLEDVVDGKLIVNFDGDDAGYDAAERLCENVLPNVLLSHLVYIAMPPDGMKDPDDFLNARPAEEYVTFLRETALPWYEWLGNGIVFREHERMDIDNPDILDFNISDKSPKISASSEVQTVDFDIKNYLNEHRDELLAAIGAPSDYIAGSRKNRPRPQCSEETVEKLARLLDSAHRAIPGLNVGALVHGWADSLSCGDGAAITPLYIKILKRAEKNSDSWRASSPLAQLETMPPPPWVVDELPYRRKKAVLAESGMSGSGDGMGITEYMSNPSRRKKSLQRIGMQEGEVDRILSQRSEQSKRLRTRPRRTAEEIVLRTLIFASETERLDSLNELLEVMIRCQEKDLPFWTSPHRVALFEFLAEVEGNCTAAELAEKAEGEDWWIPEIEYLFFSAKEETDKEWKDLRVIETSNPVLTVTAAAESIEMMAGKVASEMALEETRGILENIQEAQEKNELEKVDHLIAKHISLKSAVDRTRYMSPDEMEVRREEEAEVRNDIAMQKRREMTLELLKTNSVPHPSEKPPWIDSSENDDDM